MVIQSSNYFIKDIALVRDISGWVRKQKILSILTCTCVIRTRTTTMNERHSTTDFCCAPSSPRRKRPLGILKTNIQHQKMQHAFGHITTSKTQQKQEYVPGTYNLYGSFLYKSQTKKGVQSAQKKKIVAKKNLSDQRSNNLVSSTVS